jgi:hypothetical protein
MLIVSLGPDAGGVKDSEGPQVLRFEHSYRNGALCSLEVDLATVRAGTFRPQFIWSGQRPSKMRELIAWTLSVFATVANHAQASVRFSFWREPGRSETWDCRPGERPQRIKREDEPCRNLATAIMATAIGRVAVHTQSDAEGVE